MICSHTDARDKQRRRPRTRAHTRSERGAETNFQPGNLCRGTGKVQKAFKQAHAPSECAVRVLTMRWHDNVASELTAARAKKKRKKRESWQIPFLKKKINKFEVFTVLHVLDFWCYILFCLFMTWQYQSSHCVAPAAASDVFRVCGRNHFFPLYFWPWDILNLYRQQNTAVKPSK